MTQAFRCGSVLLTLALVPGCQQAKEGGKLHPEDGKAGPHEAVTIELIAELNKAADIARTVKDERSASKAAPQFKVVARRLQRTMRRFKSLGQPAKGDDRLLRTKYQESLEEAAQHLGEEMDRIAGIPEAQAILKIALREFDQFQDKAPKKK